MNDPLLRSTAFIRAAQRLIRKNPSAANELREALNKLTEDPFYPRLRTHKLKGAFLGVMACSAGYDLRILYEFVPHEGKTAILLLTIGTHDEVY
jgi:addiction module RelE/StbE family toxin